MEDTRLDLMNMEVVCSITLDNGGRIFTAKIPFEQWLSTSKENRERVFDDLRKQVSLYYQDY